MASTEHDPRISVTHLVFERVPVRLYTPVKAKGMLNGVIGQTIIKYWCIMHTLLYIRWFGIEARINSCPNLMQNNYLIWTIILSLYIYSTILNFAVVKMNN